MQKWHHAAYAQYRNSYLWQQNKSLKMEERDLFNRETNRVLGHYST